MNRSRAVAAAAVWLAIGVSSLSAQDLSRYRAYVLDSSLETVRSTGGSRVTDTRTVHARPARIQELEWRSPYVSSGAEMADPVRTSRLRWNHRSVGRSGRRVADEMS